MCYFEHERLEQSKFLSIRILEPKGHLQPELDVFVCVCVCVCVFNMTVPGLKFARRNLSGDQAQHITVQMGTFPAQESP